VPQAAGHYFLPGSARYVEAVLQGAGDGQSLRVLAADGAVLAEAPLRAVKATSRLGQIVRKLDFPGGGRFETADNDAVDALLRGGSGLLHRLEKSWRVVLGSVLAAAAMAAWFVFYGVPLAADGLARHTPANVSRFMTRQALETLDGRALRPTTLSDRQRHVTALFDTIAAHEDRPAGSYRLLLRNAPIIGPNAFAFPDGSIVMTDQLVAMARNDTEIEGVFAHEMAHVNHAHVLQRVYQASLVPAAIAFITGDATQVGHFATILPGVMLQASYSRAFEQQADDDAAKLLRRMGEDPGQLAGLLERIEQKMCGKGDCGPSWLGSHPATAERAARLRQPASP
jgi:Zn-dependent protease with chaperone function